MGTARQIEAQAKSLYQQDYFAWTQQQAKMLRAGQMSTVDAQNLAEYLALNRLWDCSR